MTPDEIDQFIRDEARAAVKASSVAAEPAPVASSGRELSLTPSSDDREVHVSVQAFGGDVELHMGMWQKFQ